MPKFTCTERLTVKNIVAMLTIKRIPDSEIIKSIFDQTGKTTTSKQSYSNKARDQTR